MSKKQKEWFYMLVTAPHDFWVAFKAMVGLGAAILIVWLAARLIGLWATIGIFVVLPVLYTLFWIAITKETFDAGKLDINDIWRHEGKEDK